MSGMVFGRLTVISQVENKGKDVSWLCRCQCGSSIDVRGHALRTGNTSSCGCLHKEQLITRNKKAQSKGRTTHGMSQTRTFRIWADMRKRCENPRSTHYHNYGGRGITVCERWGRFEHFLEDMREAPEDRTLDRIDVNGNYEPGNCRWATIAQQARNKRTNRIISFNGRAMCLADWAQSLNMSICTLHTRLADGWTVEQALTIPIEKGRPLWARPSA